MNQKYEKIVSPRSEIADQITLYKYVTMKALEGLLRYGDFKVSYRKDCNDPQEMTPAGYLPHAENMYSSRGFVSFTTKADCAPLWGNYADKYSGACVMFQFEYFDNNKYDLANENEQYIYSVLKEVTSLGFDVKYLKAFLDDKDGMLKTSISRHLLIKCMYQKDRKRVEHQGFSRSHKQALQDGERYWWRVMCTKDVDWKYEDEYRLPLSVYDISRIDDSFPPMYFTNIPTPYIRKIILGPECTLSPYEVGNMLHFCKKENRGCLLPDNISVIKAQYSRETYELNMTGNTPSEYDR